MTQSPGQRVTVFVIDDDVRMLAVCRQILEHAGHNVLVAQRGEDAIGTFHEHHPTIDVAVVDWKLPDLSGDEIIEQMLEIDPEARIVFFTGYAVDEETRRRVEPKTKTLLRKPFDGQQLLDAIQAAMGSDNHDSGSRTSKG